MSIAFISMNETHFVLMLSKCIVTVTVLTRLSNFHAFVVSYWRNINDLTLPYRLLGRRDLPKASRYIALGSLELMIYWSAVRCSTHCTTLTHQAKRYSLHKHDVHKAKRYTLHTHDVQKVKKYSLHKCDVNVHVSIHIPETGYLFTCWYLFFALHI